MYAVYGISLILCFAISFAVLNPEACGATGSQGMIALLPGILWRMSGCL